MLRRVDTYVLKQIMLPLSATLGVSALLLLLERMFRLFDMVANQGGPVAVVFRMLGSLLPHYIGTALPLGFFLGVLLAFRKLSQNSELEALTASGTSLFQLMRSAFALGAVLLVLNLLLIGFVQPQGRYSFHSLMFNLSSGAFGASIRSGEYRELGEDFTLRIGESRDKGGQLLRIFAQKERSTGHVTTITAREGSFLATPDGSTILLRLKDGIITDILPGRPSPRVFRFDQHDWPLKLPQVEAFRARGAGEELEMTLPELWTEARASEDERTANRFMASFHERLVRSITMLALPFLAVGLGVSSKRRKGSAGATVGIVMLLTLHKAIEFGVASAGLGVNDPILVIWGPFILFSLLSAFFFYVTSQRVGVAPLAWLEDGLQFVSDQFGKLRRGSSNVVEAPSNVDAAGAK